MREQIYLQQQLDRLLKYGGDHLIAAEDPDAQEWRFHVCDKAWRPFCPETSAGIVVFSFR